MSRTSTVHIATYVLIGLVAGGSLPSIAVRLGEEAPRPTWMAAVLLLVAAIVVGLVAWNTWQAVHRRHQRVQSDHGVFLLALAKASSRVGALFAGAYGGFALAFVDVFGTENGRERVVHGAGAAVAAALLLAAGLLLERACMLPADDDDDEEDGAQSATGAA